MRGYARNYDALQERVPENKENDHVSINYVKILTVKEILVVFVVLKGFLYTSNHIQ